MGGPLRALTMPLGGVSGILCLYWLSLTRPGLGRSPLRHYPCHWGGSGILCSYWLSLTTGTRRVYTAISKQKRRHFLNTHPASKEEVETNYLETGISLNNTLELVS